MASRGTLLDCQEHIFPIAKMSPGGLGLATSMTGVRALLDPLHLRSGLLPQGRASSQTKMQDSHPMVIGPSIAEIRDSWTIGDSSSLAISKGCACKGFGQ